MAKRAMDLILGSAGLVLCSPIIFLAALAVLTTMGPPILFRQRRPGRFGRSFTLLKFRTMITATDEDGVLLDDGARLTPFGRLLRSLSIDELPQLFNVLKGDLSLVGPRPLLMQYLDRYSHEQRRRHNVLPGITGWAQVNGRNALSWPEKFRLDVWYVDHWSLRLDVRILCRTIWQVLRREGISQDGHATMAELTIGTNHRSEHNK